MRDTVQQPSWGQVRRENDVAWRETQSAGRSDSWYLINGGRRRKGEKPDADRTNSEQAEKRVVQQCIHSVNPFRPFEESAS